jgi:hypothetical protein
MYTRIRKKCFGWNLERKADGYKVRTQGKDLQVKSLLVWALGQ